jgi:hypothetical protein
MNDTNKNIPREQWKDEILSSIEGIQRSEVPPFLFTRILSRLRAEETRSSSTMTARISRPTLAFSVAGFVLLCCVNVWIVIGSAVQTHDTNQAPMPTAPSSLETVSFDLY